MSHDRYLRFHVKAQVNGRTQVDGFLSAESTGVVINDILTFLNAPAMDFSILHRALEGYHYHVDGVVGYNLFACEISCIADPEGLRKSREPLPLPSSPDPAPV